LSPFGADDLREYEDVLPGRDAPDANRIVREVRSVPQICEPGERKCDGETILQCSYDGSKWKLAVICLEGQTCLDAKCCWPD